MKNSLALAFIVFVCGASSFIHAGSLTPPAPPGPTMKTLNEVEPRKPIHDEDLPLSIIQSGSYYLTENVSVSTTNTAGITISAPFATLDLNGFCISGPGNAAGSNGVGISVATSCEKFVLRNGTIRNWRGSGIDATEAKDVLIDQVSLVENGGYGVGLTTGTVTNCNITHNLAQGIFINTGASAAGLISGNRCTHNGSHGIQGSTTDGFVISGNICSFNRYSGIASTYSHGKIINNTCNSNDISGISATGSTCLIDGNSTDNNVTYGIISQAGGADSSTIIRNTASGNLTDDYSFSAATKYGPITVLTPGVSIVSQHPWANFSF